MKPAIKKLWVEALRSGKYQQVTGHLRWLNGQTRSYGYCCLGVLCDLHRKQKRKGNWVDNRYLDRAGLLPMAVVDWAGLDSCDPEVTKHDTLSSLNDGGHNFEQIAKLIEEKL